MFKGKTVAIIGNGPGEFDIPKGSIVIAVNRAVQRFPDADLLVSIDGNHGTDFDGPTLTGFECGGYEVVTITPNNIVHIRNNALAAIRIAANAGASKIILFGFDPVRYEEMHNFYGFAEGLEAVIAECRAKGMEVVE